jgi:hypothetical protein
MKSSPRVARWLLSQFGCSAQNEAILGDLDEQFHAGRSRTWYWTQALTAVVTGFQREIAAHRFLAVRALGISWTLLVGYAILFKRMAAHLIANVRPDSEWAFQLFHREERLLCCLLVQPGSLWKVHMSIYLALYFIVSIALSCLAGAAIGWIVARLHRPHQKAAVLLYMLSVYIALGPFFFFLASTARDSRTLFLLSLGLIGNVVTVGSGWLGLRLMRTTRS